MISKLYDVNNNLITNKITDALPTYDVIKVKNRLLDGTYHTQTIGSAMKKMEIECDVSEAGKAMIDDAYIKDAPVKLVYYGNYYIGLIQEYPEWKKIVKGADSKRLYTAKFIINVQSEGVDQ